MRRQRGEDKEHACDEDGESGKGHCGVVGRQREHNLVLSKFESMSSMAVEEKLARARRFCALRACAISLHWGRMLPPISFIHSFISVALALARYYPAFCFF